MALGTPDEPGAVKGVNNLLTRALAWLGPRRAGDPVSTQLGVILILSLVWDAVIALDNNSMLLGASPLAVVLTVAIYPLMVAIVAVTIAAPEKVGHVMAVGRRGFSVAAPVLVVAGATVLFQVPSLVAARAPVSDDVTPSVICAARDLLNGADPYATPELRCLHSLRLPASLGTALKAGPYAKFAAQPAPGQAEQVAHASSRHAFQTAAYPRFGYPPLSFLSMLPVATSGRSWWVAWTLAWALIWLLAMGRLSRPWWPAVAATLLLQWGTGSVLGAATQGDAEFFTFALMSLALVTLAHPRCSALALGLSIATNPLAWVMTPGYVALSVHLPDRGKRLAWLVGTVLVAFTPWLLHFPDAFGAMVNLVTQPSFPVGTGLVAVSVVQPLLPLFPRGAYFALLAAAEVGILGAAAVSRRVAMVAPILVVSALWLSWRSDANYLAQLPPLACATVIGLSRLRPPSPASPNLVPGPPPMGLAPSDEVGEAGFEPATSSL